MQLTAEDRVSIMDLMARYGHCLDSGDLDGYMRLFAPDAVLFGTHHGHLAIRAYVDQVIQRRAANPAKRMHFVGLPTIAGTRERATVKSYVLFVPLGAEAPVSAVGEYRDECVQIDGQWVFAARTMIRLAGKD